jgi:hypothetical protein
MKLRAAFHNFANALQKAGIYIKMSAAAKAVRSAFISEA